MDFYYPIETERLIISNLVAGKLEEAQRTLDKVMEINMNYIKSANVNISFLRNVLSGTIVRMIQLVNCGNDTELVKGFCELRHANSINDLNVQIKKIFVIIHNIVRDDANARSKEMIDAVCKIIEKDYEKDISLAEIAYKFNISQSYLSELFKKYTGDNFKNYVNRKKIDKAKEIIENNKQIKVKQLSEMLGFNDVNTFIKVFGKYEGMSPGQYATAMAVKSEHI
jgi:YesN/AraC family two-component response regulator